MGELQDHVLILALKTTHMAYIISNCEPYCPHFLILFTCLYNPYAVCFMSNLKNKIIHVKMHFQSQSAAFLGTVVSRY